MKIADDTSKNWNGHEKHNEMMSSVEAVASENKPIGWNVDS